MTISAASCGVLNPKRIKKLIPKLNETLEHSFKITVLKEYQELLTKKYFKTGIFVHNDIKFLICEPLENKMECVWIKVYLLL
jgi:hypothetical protein